MVAMTPCDNSLSGGPIAIFMVVRVMLFNLIMVKLWLDPKEFGVWVLGFGSSFIGCGFKAFRDVGDFMSSTICFFTFMFPEVFTVFHMLPLQPSFARLKCVGCKLRLPFYTSKFFLV